MPVFPGEKTPGCQFSQLARWGVEAQKSLELPSFYPSAPIRVMARWGVARDRSPVYRSPLYHSPITNHMLPYMSEVTGIQEAIRRLVELYDATGKNEKADEWRKKLDEATPAVKP